VSKAKKPNTLNAKARKRLRQMLHDDLDRMLNGETVENDGTKMTTLDSMTMRALEGFGFNVRVHSLSPEQIAAGVTEAPGTVEPGTPLGLVRE
jgi:hypothetical protein